MPIHFQPLQQTLNCPPKALVPQNQNVNNGVVQTAVYGLVGQSPQRKNSLGLPAENS